MAIDGGGASIPVGHVSRTPLNAEAFPQVRRATQGVRGNGSPWVGGCCPAYLTGTSADPPAYTQSFTGRDYRWPLLLLMVPAYEEKHLELWSNGLGG